MYRLKGTSVDRVYVVFGARVDLGFVLLFVKNGFVVRVRSLKVPVHHSNSHYVSATRRLALDNRPTQLNSPNTYTHTLCTLSCTAAGRQGGREEAMVDGGMEGGELGQGEGREGGNIQGRYPGRELASIQYIHKPSHNAALALETLVQMKNSEQV